MSKRSVLTYYGKQGPCRFCGTRFVDGGSVIRWADYEGDPGASHMHPSCDAIWDYSQLGNDDISPDSFLDLMQRWTLEELKAAVKGLSRKDRALAYILWRVENSRHDHASNFWPSWEQVVEQAQRASFTLKPKERCLYSGPMVQHFNIEADVNAPVYYTDDMGNVTRQRLWGDAWVLGGGIPVVRMRGKVGGYHMDRFQFCHVLEPDALMQADGNLVDLDAVKASFEAVSVTPVCESRNKAMVVTGQWSPLQIIEIMFFPQPTPPRVRIHLERQAFKAQGSLSNYALDMMAMSAFLEGLHSDGVISSCDFPEDEPDHAQVCADVLSVRHAILPDKGLTLRRKQDSERPCLDMWRIEDDKGRQWVPEIQCFVSCSLGRMEWFTLCEAYRVVGEIKAKCYQRPRLTQANDISDYAKRCIQRYQIFSDHPGSPSIKPFLRDGFWGVKVSGTGHIPTHGDELTSEMVPLFEIAPSFFSQEDALAHFQQLRLMIYQDRTSQQAAWDIMGEREPTPEDDIPF